MWYRAIDNQQKKFAGLVSGKTKEYVRIKEKILKTRGYTPIGEPFKVGTWKGKDYGNKSRKNRR